MRRLTFTKARPGRSLLLVLVTIALLLLGAQNAHEAVALETETINLNTGYDQNYQPIPRLMDAGEQDNEWRVIVDPITAPLPNYDIPPSGYATGRPADVVVDRGGWAPNLSGSNPNYQNSHWISVNPAGNLGNHTLPSPALFQYALYFTLPPGFTSPNLTMTLNADDDITKVTLGRANNGPPCTLFADHGGKYNLAPLAISSIGSPCAFNSGANVNELIVTVEDTLQVATGLIVAGSVTYQCCDRLPVIQTPGLQSISFWESTFAAPTEHKFLRNGLELSARLSTLGASNTNNDFVGDPGAPLAEAYDVFYSTWNGTPAVNGQFVTIEARVPYAVAPSGGGLNIAAVQLNFSSGAVRFADSVASFVALGDNAIPSIVGNAVDDGLLSTDTTMGNTSAPPPAPQRLRLTVGFPCNCTPPPSDMFAWWPLDETSGNQVHDLAGGHTGTASPGPIGPSSLATNGPEPANLWPPVMAAGGSKVGNALHFWDQGIGNRYVRVPDNPSLRFGNHSDFSIDAWVLIDQYSGTAIQPIVEKMQYTGKSAPLGYRFYIEGGVLKFKMSPDSPPTTHFANTQMTLGVWHHVAVVVDSSPVVALYVDGSVVSSPIAFVPGDISSTADLIIGGSAMGPAVSYSDIAIDEVEIFNRALTQNEVNRIYNAGSDGKCLPADVSVGGVATLTVSDPGSPAPWTPLAAVAAAALAVMSAGLWYARRRGSPR